MCSITKTALTACAVSFGQEKQAHCRLASQGCAAVAAHPVPYDALIISRD
jgi:hypothetical protein